MSSLLDEIEADATPTVAHADVCVDGRLLADYLDAQEQMLGRKQRDAGMLEQGQDLQEITDRFKTLHERVVAKTRRYTFRCVSRKDRERLADKFPPTAKQAKQGHQWDAAKYEPALAAIALVEIDGKSVDDDEARKRQHFQKLYTDLPEGRNGWGVIAAALDNSNFQGTQVPKSVRDIADRTVSALNSITPQDGESA